MRPNLEAAAKGHRIYAARRQEYDTGQNIPFRVSPEPLQLNSRQTGEIQSIGNDITAYFQAIDRLYRTDDTVRGILDTGKPEIFLGQRPADYLFVRPDLIVTPQGFTMCELETSPFGLALAEILNHGYQQAGFETMVGENALTDHVRRETPAEGTIVYSNKTASYSGQMTFLAEEVFSGEGRQWQVAQAAEVDAHTHPNIYRGFYLAEYMTDTAVKPVLETTMQNSARLLPSPTPHLEEKAVLSFLWDKRFESRLQADLGNAGFDHLREVVPPNWIVGQEAFFAPGLPHGVETSADLAGLSKSKRTLVLKSSGFAHDTSWGEGVHFLHKKSAVQAGVLLDAATQDISRLHVVQEFHKAADVPMSYETNQGIVPMTARVRLTPYFSLNGNLVGIKATGVENNTDFIHASSTSINTAVSSGLSNQG